MIKIRTGCQYVGYFYYSENLNWAAQSHWLGRGLDIVGLHVIISVLYITWMLKSNVLILFCKVLMRPIHLFVPIRLDSYTYS